MSPYSEIAIGELSRQTQCNIETIRYYERIGLLPSPRRQGRYRRYDVDAIARLRFIRRARQLGFTLDEVRALLALSAERGREACVEVRELAAGHLEDVRAKIADLRLMEGVLADAIRRCEEGESAGCPVIASLSTTPSD
ncbi:MAG TPA: helix-turn-helix domain-containing protein [Stellaceae bacterium]|nr:helix-turn-helix domain-containing protein [Stellaceae bacterium]